MVITARLVETCLFIFRISFADERTLHVTNCHENLLHNNKTQKCIAIRTYAVNQIKIINC